MAGHISFCHSVELKLFSSQLLSANALVLPFILDPSSTSSERWVLFGWFVFFLNNFVQYYFHC